MKKGVEPPLDAAADPSALRTPHYYSERNQKLKSPRKDRRRRPPRRQPGPRAVEWQRWAGGREDEWTSIWWRNGESCSPWASEGCQSTAAHPHRSWRFRTLRVAGMRRPLKPPYCCHQLMDWTIQPGPLCLFFNLLFLSVWLFLRYTVKHDSCFWTSVPKTAITGTLFITMTTSGGGCYRSLGSVVSSYTK